MNSKIISLLTAVTLIMLNTSCIGDALAKKWEYLVDNPLNTEIVIKIDEKEYTIPALTTQSIKIAEGKHTLTYNGSSVNFVTQVNSNKTVTIMNPTLSNYMLHAYIYIKEDAKNKDVSMIYDDNSHEYMAKEGIVRLPVRVLNTLFFEKFVTPWSFGLDEDAKSKINTSAPGKKLVHHKIFRKAQYLTELADELPVGVVFPDRPSQKLSDLPKYKFPTESFLCDCEEFNSYVRVMETRWNEMIADPSDIRSKITKLSYDRTVDSGKMDKACRTQYNPGRDEKSYKEASSRLSKEMRYITDASSFIVE